MGRLAQICVIVCTALALGCNAIGPRTIPGARINYNEAIARSWDEQLLLNLVRLRYRDTPLFRRVLQSIWHQVNNGLEVFVIGQILDDATVKGGTGWGAEFAKLCNKPLFVFDQTRDAWHCWNGDAWDEISSPVIGQPRFTGTGTRFIQQNGERAIEELFERSFR